MTPDTRTVLLSGVVGSTAYGLAHAQSDVDRLGVFVEPTRNLVGFTKPTETFHQTGTEEDITLHEVAKFLRLAMACNPTILELLWLDSYEGTSVPGKVMVSFREKFLSANGVRNAYLGYATQQFKKLQARGDGSFSSDTRNRSLKHARHLLRLLTAGLELYRTGTMSVRVAYPEMLRTDAETLVANPELAQDVIRRAEEDFDQYTTALPSGPDQEFWTAFLMDVRQKMW